MSAQPLPPPQPYQFATFDQYLMAYQIWQQGEIQRQRSNGIGALIIVLLLIFVVLPLLVGALMIGTGAIRS